MLPITSTGNFTLWQTRPRSLSDLGNRQQCDFYTLQTGPEPKDNDDAAKKDAEEDDQRQRPLPLAAARATAPMPLCTSHSGVAVIRATVSITCQSSILPRKPARSATAC